MPQCRAMLEQCESGVGGGREGDGMCGVWRGKREGVGRVGEFQNSPGGFM